MGNYWILVIFVYLIHKAWDLSAKTCSPFHGDIIAYDGDIAVADVTTVTNKMDGIWVIDPQISSRQAEGKL